ncbi:MAG: bifunctional metallophosphatase/5'-nucleotidase, partial [Methanobacteriota archaeon]
MDASKPVLVHCGDLMVGTLMFNQYFGVPEFQILNQLGFDAFLLGNHEFDVGAAQLGEILKSARLDSHLKILCSNLRNLNGVAPLDSLVHSHLILKRGHLQIGLFGLTTPNANLESNPAPLFIDTSLVVVAQREIKSLKEAGCQVIIMLSHLGLPLDRQLATFLSGVDAIVGGHSHDVLKQPLVINGIPVVQAGEFYRYVGRLRLLYDGRHTQVLDYKLKEIDETVPEVPGIAEEISRLKSGVVSAYSELLGHPYHPLARNRKHLSHQPQFPEHLQSSAGRLVTAALHAYVPEADCALEPAGHIVEDLYPGEVTPADLFRIYPYGFSPNDHLGFRIATLQLRGKELVGV